MKLWGSSYLLHDVDPVKLIGTLGSFTDSKGVGTVQISFAQEHGVFAVARTESRCEFRIKWEVALRLLALMHILVLQNRMLRGEALDMRISPDRARIFHVSEGWRSSPIMCSWNAANPDVQCGPASAGSVEQLDLWLKEDAAVELIMALAEQIARNGTTTATR